MTPGPINVVTTFPELKIKLITPVKYPFITIPFPPLGILKVIQKTLFGQSLHLIRCLRRNEQQLFLTKGPQSSEEIKTPKMQRITQGSGELSIWGASLVSWERHRYVGWMRTEGAGLELATGCLQVIRMDNQSQKAAFSCDQGYHGDYHVMRRSVRMNR